MPTTSSRPWRTTAAVVALVAAADQATTSLTARAGHSSAVFPLRNPSLSLELVHAGRWPEVVAMAVGVAVGAALLLPRVRTGAVSRAAAGAPLGGAVSNLADRALFGSVRDFLVLGPVIANLADLALAAGFVLLTRDLLPRRDRRPRPADLRPGEGR